MHIFCLWQPAQEKIGGSRTSDFWCCHCTLLQANARYREFIYYKAEDSLTVAQFIPAEIQTEFFGTKAKVIQKMGDLTGSYMQINPVANSMEERPNYMQMHYEVRTDMPVEYIIKFRMPWWLQGEMEIFINKEKVSYEQKENYAVIKRFWNQDEIDIRMPKGITCWPLADEKNTVAFLDGPVVLAGLISEERTLVGDIGNPYSLICPHHERQWSEWTSMYKTVNQMRGFYFKPLKDIGNQDYTVYFPVISK